MSFDTRSKIVSIEQLRGLLQSQDAIAFVSSMEVPQAGQLRKLEQCAAGHPGKLVVILTDPESPLVPMDARAEVTAALRVVDYVVPSPAGAGPALAALQPALTVHDEEEDRERTRSLIEHVRSRSRN